MSRVCWVGRRFSREGFLFDAHNGCHGQQSGNHETDFDTRFFVFSLCVVMVRASILGAGLAELVWQPDATLLTPVRVGAILLLLLLFHILHGTAAGLGRADKHGVVTARRADMLHFLVPSFSFAGADDFDAAFAGLARVLLTDGHHFYVLHSGGHRHDHDGFALAADHCDGVSWLQCLRLRLRRDMVHVHRMLHRFDIVRCAGRAGKPHSQRQDDRESRAEADVTEVAVFHFHNCAFHFVVLCSFRC